MLINEIFYSVQGEVDVGMPAIFIRTAGCNLIKSNNACKFCDTLYAEEGKEMSVNEIFIELCCFKCKNVVITGGCPLIQSDLSELVRLLYSKGFRLFIETNGTIYNKDAFDCVEISCSPKKQLIDEDVLYNLNTFHKARFKFVYENKNELWWESLIKKLKIPDERVYIMCEGKTKEEQFEKMEEVVEYCKSKCYNFTPRLHVLLWGNKKGV